MINISIDRKQNNTFDVTVPINGDFECFAIFFKGELVSKCLKTNTFTWNFNIDLNMCVKDHLKSIFGTTGYNDERVDIVVKVNDDYFIENDTFSIAGIPIFKNIRNRIRIFEDVVIESSYRNKIQIINNKIKLCKDAEFIISNFYKSALHMFDQFEVSNNKSILTYEIIATYNYGFNRLINTKNFANIWAVLHEKWKFMAKDENGDVYVYDLMPSKDYDDHKWCTHGLGDSFEVTKLFDFDNKFNFCNWDNTLIARPVHL